MPCDETKRRVLWLAAGCLFGYYSINQLLLLIVKPIMFFLLLLPLFFVSLKPLDSPHFPLPSSLSHNTDSA
jgi:hypothetical protein